MLLIMSVTAFGQQKTYKLTWETVKNLSVSSGVTVQVPAFNSEHFVFDFYEGLQFVDQWETKSSVDENSVSITQVSYQSISIEELKDLDEKTIPNKLTFSLKNSKARGKQYVFFRLSPIVKDAEGRFKKVIAFQLNYKTGQNQYRSAALAKNNLVSAASSNSVLASGQWYRFYIDTTGVFKLTKSFLQRLGVNVNNVDPRTIKVFGHGGRMIPYSNAEPYPYDVPENAIKFVGEEDGVFNNEDYILFYGQGPTGYNEESATHINCYTDKTYYYINVGAGYGKRIQPLSQPTGAPDLIIDTFEDYQFHEVDQYNLVSLGRRWFGDRFDIETKKNFEFNFPDLVTSQPVNLKVVVASASESSSAMSISLNESHLTTLSLSGVNSPIYASGATFSSAVNVSTSKITVGLEFDNRGNPSALGYLDYISVEALRQLNFNNKQFQFKNSIVTSQSGVGQYNISNAERLSEIWEVTDIYNVLSLENTNNSANLSFTAPLGSLKTYVAVSPSDYFEPKLDGKTTVANQNIKGSVFQNSQGEFQDVDYIIVAPDNMLTHAERLAQINQDQYGLNVKVLGLSEIYNEFSSGNPDIGAIRNVVKYVYDNASSPENRIKYLCLFGDSSYDYKNRVQNNTNIVPSWYSYNSFSLTS